MRFLKAGKRVYRYKCANLNKILKHVIKSKKDPIVKRIIIRG